MAKQNEQIFITWRTKEFEHYEKGFGWYLTFSIIFAMLIGYEIIFKDYFAALTFLVVAAVLLIFARLVPKEIQIEIAQRGIYIDQRQIPYTSIKHFWIVEHNQAKDLHLETTAYLNRFVIIPLNDQDSMEVRDTLVRFVPESDSNRESVARRLSRFLRF